MSILSLKVLFMFIKLNRNYNKNKSNFRNTCIHVIYLITFNVQKFKNKNSYIIRDYLCDKYTMFYTHMTFQKQFH